VYLAVEQLFKLFLFWIFMNFKLKLALVAAAAALLAAPAFADIGDANLDGTTVATAAAVNDLAVAELTVGAAYLVGNVALIAQEGSGGLVALIDQTSTGLSGGNWASIAQASATPDVAAITQVGDGNRAAVFQRQ